MVDEPWTLVGTARTVGGYVWLEERLFEVVGGWVASVPEADIKLRFDADSYHHAWHASLWRERLPTLSQFVPDDFVAPATPALEPVMALLGQAATTVERVVALYRVVVPRLAVGYQHHLVRATSASDGPIARALELVLSDECRDWQRGEALVQGALISAAEVSQAAAWQGRLEALLAGE